MASNRSLARPGTMFALERLGRAALVMSLLVGACGDGSEPGNPRAPRELDDTGGGWILRLVGAVEETDVRVALLLGRGKSRVFFCGGPQFYATATRWFNPEYDGGEHVDFEEQNWRVHGHLTAAGLIGDV